jgi:hypothetical protein
MASPFGSAGFSGNPYPGEGSHNFGRSRVFLVAIHGGMLPPFLHESNPMQRLRVLLLPPNQPSEFDSSDLLPGVFRQALPPMPPSLPARRDERVQPRPVRGEILRDQEGRLYEKIGEQIRPLQKLVSGPRGQVIELVPSRERMSEISVPAESEEPSLDSKKNQDGNPARSSQQQRQNRKSVQTGPIAQPGAENPKPAAYRKFFADPGQRRVVRLGDFKLMLAPQLMHPERLRDTHRLACYLQVYEAATAQRLESLAATVLGDTGPASQLQLMTEAITHQLGLTPLLRIRPRVPSNFPREAGLLLPHERVFRLQLAQDPTADDTAPPNRQAGHLQTGDFNHVTGLRPAPASESSQKTVIPERFLKPWEFKFTRDEALYDMNVTATFAGGFSALGKRLKGWISGRGELKKWQILLSGKSADEQLWAVRPPKGGLSHPAIRDWACTTLETAGYAPRTMLVEWEIFWRRKGL